MRHVHDARVVQLAFRFEQRHQYGELAVLGTAVVVELFQEVLVLMLRCRLVHFVLHLEHDRDVFKAVFIVAEYEVALAAARCVVVFLKVGVGEERAHAVELRAAVYFKSLAYHLGRHPCLQVLVVVNLLLLLFQLHFVSLLYAVLT